jgi:DNA recombination protein RmuC
LLGGGFLTLFLYLKKITTELSKQQGKPDQSILLLQQQLQEQVRALTDMRSTLDQKMIDTHKTLELNTKELQQTMQQQFAQNTRVMQGITGQSSKMIAEITEKLTNLDKTNQQVIGFSEQLNNLEKVLTNQKKRGSLGEAGLQLVLENILPPTAFTLQYGFEDGDVVDAAIFSKEGIIPVDAKFSLDNYNRVIQATDPAEKKQFEKDFKNDLKKRIDETSKYIKPKENTLDFAFMFIPAEAIYYDLLVNEVGAVKVNTQSLIEYAFREKKVIIVSPTTFAAYLQTVLQGLRALQIEEDARSIRKHVSQLQRHIAAHEEFMKKLGSSMSTTVNHYNRAYKELGKMDKDIVKITSGERVVEPGLIEKPKMEE